MTTSPLARPRLSRELVLAAARRLTARDRRLCQVLYDHHVLVTDHVVDLLFDSPRAAQARLLALYELRVLDRFRPFRPLGSAPYHWVLDEVGVEVVAAERGIEVPRRGWVRARSAALASSQRLSHLLGVNGFFCALARTARHTNGASLDAWWPERRCAAEWAGVVTPDAFGAYREGPRRVAFFLEYDRGTETVGRVAEKLSRYEDLARAIGSCPVVLFAFPSAAREAAVRDALRAAGLVPVATASAPFREPAGPMWSRLGSSERRRLVALGEDT